MASVQVRLAFIASSRCTADCSVTGYNERKGTAFSQVQRADDEDDEDELREIMTSNKGQIKLNFAPKTASKAKVSTSKAKAKGKSKRVVADSDEDSDAMGSSNTVRGDDMEIDELDDETATQRSTTSGRGASRTAPAKRSAAARKAAPQTIMIDDDESDSDSGLTFKVREGSSRSRVVFAGVGFLPCSRPTIQCDPLFLPLLTYPFSVSLVAGLWQEGGEWAP